MPLGIRLGTVFIIVFTLFAGAAFAGVIVTKDKAFEFTLPPTFKKVRTSSSLCMTYKLVQPDDRSAVQQIAFNYWDSTPYLSKEQFLKNLERGRNPKTISSNNIRWEAPVFKTVAFGQGREMIQIQQSCTWFGKTRHNVWFVIQSKPGVPIHKDNIALICWASDQADMERTTALFKKYAQNNLKINN